DMNLDYSKGEAISAFSVSRDADHPQTYSAVGGALTELLTSNTPAITRGYWREGEGVKRATGLLLEGQATNRALQSSAPEEAVWTKTNITADNDDAGSSSPDGVVTANSLTASADNGTFTQQYTTGAAVYTASCFIKRKTGTGAVSLRANTADAYTALTVTSDWTRVKVTSSSAANPTFDLKIAVNTDAVYIYGMQLEAGLYPSSYIPTGATAVQRNGESLSFYTRNVWPGVKGGDCLSFDGQESTGDDYVSVANSASGNQVSGTTTGYSVETWALIRSDGEGNYGRLLDKSQYTSGTGFQLDTRSQSGSNVAIKYVIGRATTDCTATTSTSVSINIWHHIVAAFDGTNAPKIYIDGAESAYSGSPNAGAGAFGNDSSKVLAIGNAASAGNTSDSIIQCVRIYRNKALSADDVSAAYAAGRYASLPVTGCTAQYLFQDTGNTLTDSVAANNGTISGATWTKDTSEGTLVFMYRPEMLPSEQSGLGYSELFSVAPGLIDIWKLRYDSNANNRIQFQVISNNNAYYAQPASGYCSFYTRFQRHLLLAKWSTTPFVVPGLNSGNPIRMALYDGYETDGVFALHPIAFSVNYVPPVGALPSTYSIQPSARQGMILEGFQIYDRCLSDNESKVASMLFWQNNRTGD
ncbi:MAG: LamG domain-containing protein, partial [Patescibacteria group bacterium]